MDKKILLIEDLYEEGFTSGTKARQDVRKIIDGDIFYCYIKKKSKIRDYAYSLFRLYASLPKIYARSQIVIQYPFYANERFNRICYQVLPKKAVLLIHDISNLRYEMPKKAVQREIRAINRFRKIIVHNIRMKKWLADQGIPDEKMVMLQMFDYLVEKDGQTSGAEIKDSNQQKATSEMEKARDGYTIAFAGNLGKSRFLDQLIADGNHASLKFALYGIQPSDRILESGFYRGVESPDRLPDVLEGDFGLVWDGENLEEGQEAAGRYLQYNCPHKFSLYMAAGIPVIIGKHAAMAELVEREKLGITVHDLHELSEKLAGLTIKDYEEMKKHAMIIQARVLKGIYLKTALKGCGMLK